MEEQAVDVRKRLEEVGAIITDSHIVYTSGRHGDAYINKDAVYPHTVLVESICWAMAWAFENVHVDAVVGPVAGGVVLAYETARQRGTDILCVYADKVPEGGFVIKRGFDALIRDKNVLVVEDVLTTGGSVAAVVKAAREAGARVVGVAALCNRGGVTAESIGVDRLESLLELNLQSWAPEECPLCRDLVPINTNVGHGAQFLAAQNQVVN